MFESLKKIINPNQMQYSDLLSKHGEHKYISYAELLQTNEWKQKRESIITRDENCCTNCLAIKSEYMFDYQTNILFRKDDQVFKKDIIGDSYTLGDYKKKMKIELVTFFLAKNSENYFFGLSEGGMLFGYNAGDYQKIPATDLIIQLVLEEDGSLFSVLDTKDLIGLERGVYRPRKSTKSTCLHVHHKLYVKSRLPWEYPDSDLVTLCNWCHWELHEHTIIPVYQEEDNGDLVNLNYTPCQRCNGAGVLPEYNYVKNGICFKCNGSRYENLIDKSYQERK